MEKKLATAEEDLESNSRPQAKNGMLFERGKCHFGVYKQKCHA